MAFAKPVNKRFSPSPVIFQHIENTLENENMTKNVGPQNNQRGNQNNYALCFKGVPFDLNEESLKVILNQYGKVNSVYKAVNCPYYFANCLTEKDFEAILKGMKKNSFNIKCEQAKGEKRSQINKNQQSETNSNIGSSNRNNMDSRYNYKKNENDTNNRYHGSSAGHESNYESNKQLKENTIPLQYVFQKGITQSISIKTNHESNNIIEKKFENIIKKNESFQRMSNETTLLKLNLCCNCKKPSNKICERCDASYCSTECQINDWQTHRYFCFRMPKLITIGSDENKENLISSNNKNLSLNELKQIKKDNNTINPQKNLSSNESTTNLRQFNEIISKVNHQNGLDIGVNENNLTNKRNFYKHRYNKGPRETNLKSSPNKQQSSNQQQKQVVAVDNLTKSKILESKQVSLPIVNNPPKAEIPKSGEKVIMTHCEGTNLVYIRSNNKTATEDYVNIAKQINICSQKANSLKKIPNVDDYVAAQFYQIWYRAIVLDNRDPQQIRLFCVDHGNTEVKNISELRELVPECYNLKIYPVTVHLKNVPKCGVTVAFKEYSEEIIDQGEQLKIHYKPDDIIDNKIYAELTILETNENINNKFSELLKSAIPNATKELLCEVNEVIMLDEITTELLPAGKSISIIIVGQSMIQNGIIYCISTNEFKKLNDLNEKIKIYAESNKQQYSPREGEMCIAKYDNENWYRAYCSEVNSDNDCQDLFFIDYGSDSKVSVKDIRKYPSAFILPCHTNECQISGLEELMDVVEINPNLERRLRELLPINIDICVKNIEIHQIDAVKLYLPDVIDTLKREGLLKN